MTVARSSRGLPTAVVGDPTEISAEIVHHRLHHHGKLLRRELLPDPRRIGILRAEQFLRQLEHPRLVLFGHAEDLHDDMQGIAEGYVFDEIASPASIEHTLHSGAGDLAHTRLEFPEIGRHEPALRQRPVFWMIGGIHLHQRAHQIRPARDLADAFFHCPRRQRSRAVGIVEQLVRRLTAWIWACFVTTQNGSNCSGCAMPSGLLARSQRSCHECGGRHRRPD